MIDRLTRFAYPNRSPEETSWLQSRFGGHSSAETGRWSDRPNCVDLGHFLLDSGFDFGGVIEVVGHGNMRFSGKKIRMLVTDFIDGPAVGEVIHDDLGDADAGQAFEMGGLVGGGFEGCDLNLISLK